MTTFGSVAELEAYVKDRMRPAVADVAGDALEVFMNQTAKFYGEYSPKKYKRTGSFADTPQTSVVRDSGNGCYADVYFDAGLMSHPTGTWSEGKILHSNLVGGTHGGYASGTPVYTVGLGIIRPQVKGWMKSALIANGIPVK